MPLPYPTKLGHYDVLSALGAGGMGEVYLARDRNLDRRVALKILPTEENTTSQRFRRFTQEAKAASALNHPNIAHIYEIGEADGIPFIAMEYVEGRSLQQRISDGILTGREVVQIGCQVADALDHAHTAGVIHRDIKSSNIMLTGRGQVKILDFGLAKMRRDGSASVSAEVETQIKTSPDVVLGTLQYMSPEQALGQHVDHRSDIFSFGIVLYQLTTGHLPFSGKSATETAHRITTEEPEPVSRFNYDVPAELERIIRKCLEKEPPRRYQTAADLATDLENLRRDSQTSASSLPLGQTKPATNRVWIVVAALIALVLTIGAAYWTFIKNKSVPAVTNPGSIAVLPFSNVTGDQNTEYLSDGITESIINSLSQLRSMRVMARSTVFRYKGKDVDPQTIGRELGVDAVVTGRTLRQNDTLVIQSELMKVSDGSQMWGERFNRKIADVFTIQDEISKQIADKLRLRLTGEEQQLLTKRYTDNTEAYDLYLKGRFFFSKITEDGFVKSIDFYQQAIAKDPNYALAYVGLANSYSSLGGVLGFRSPVENLPKAHAFAVRALELDDKLADAHHALAVCKLIYYWDWGEAERELKRAIDLNPNLSFAHSTYGTFLQARGLFDQAVAERQLAEKFDPLSPLVVANVGYPLYYARRYDEAIRHYKRALELNPRYSWGHLFIGQALVQKGMYQEAVAEIKEAVRLSDTADVRTHATLAHAYALDGKRDEATKILQDLQRWSRERYVSPYFIALIYVGLGNNNEAFDWLEKAYQEHHPYLILMGVEPVFDRLRKDKRFIDLESRVGLSP